MSQAKKLITPNADETQGRWYSAVVNNKTVHFQAVDNDDAEKKVEEIKKQEEETNETN